MIVRASARKHGVKDEDAIAAASSPVVSGPLDDKNPQRQLRIGFDTQARLLETVVLSWDDGQPAGATQVMQPFRSPGDERARVAW